MKIALIAPPFIPVPPVCYGGTELFIAHLAQGLTELGHHVIVYSNGQSEIDTDLRWLYRDGQWPLTGSVSETLMEVNHTAWAVHDAAQSCDVIHVNNTFGLPHSRFVDVPFVYTIHHPHEAPLSEFYSHYPDAHYVTISEFGKRKETLPNMRTIHHGIAVSRFRCSKTSRPYLAFLGRLVPVKGAHLAIQVARKAGIPLKIAGEVQPMFRDYFEREIKPQVDGKFIEYVGEADFETKNELLANARGFLFPIEWDEPFGLVMIEAMACGAPVLAFRGGSVPEVVKNGVSGFICDSVEDMIVRARELQAFDPVKVRGYAERYFSADGMVRKYAELYSQIAGTERAAAMIDLAETEHPVA